MARIVLVALILISTALLAAGNWEHRVEEGISMHHKYMHRKAKEIIVSVAKAAPDHQKEIAVWLMDEAQKLLRDNKDEVGARGILESSMAVAKLLMDAETIYSVSNLFLAAGAPPHALEGYKMVQTILPSLASAYHQIGLTLSRMNKLEEAFEAYNGAIALLPTYAITYNNVGVLLSKQGRTEEVLLSLAPFPPPPCMHAHVCALSRPLTSSRCIQALAHYSAALSIDNNYQDARNNVEAAKKQLQEQEKESAISTLEEEDEEEVRLMVQHLPVQGSTDEMVTTALRRLIQDAQARRSR